MCKVFAKEYKKTSYAANRESSVFEGTAGTSKGNGSSAFSLVWDTLLGTIFSRESRAMAAESHHSGVSQISVT